MEGSKKLDSIDTLDIKKLTFVELESLAQEIRDFLIHSVNKTGGHLASNLGVVELTIALYYTFNPPRDSFIFDVSHQAYVHKILSGRKNFFDTLRQKKGLSGFTNPLESEYDNAQLGHAGTAISIAMGIQQSHLMSYASVKECPFSIAIVGDASIANGVAFEALNNIDSLNLKKLVIILNDNNMSISKTVGGLSKILTKIIAHPYYHTLKRNTKRLLYNSKVLFSLVSRFKKTLKKNLYQHNIFEELGVRYIGPIDGHNIEDLSNIFKMIVEKENTSDPLLIHIVTKKGKGYSYSEDFPEKYHGVSVPSPKGEISQTYTQVVEKELPLMQAKYGNIVAVTAAMKKGTGLELFAKQYPNNFFDFGIAESHAVAFSSFLSRCHSIKPYIAIYSTFLQRALDQIFQEVIIQPNLNPVFLIDRAGFVGEDGVTHHGLYDIGFLKSFPGCILMSPKSSHELVAMLDFSYYQKLPVFMRYPKANDSLIPLLEKTIPIEIGKSEFVIKDPLQECSIITYGPIIEQVVELLDRLPKLNLINLRFAKPLDLQLLDSLAVSNTPIITIEEHSILGGVGESIASYFMKKGHINTRVVNLGIKDALFAHASRHELLEDSRLKGDALLEDINLVIKSSPLN